MTKELQLTIDGQEIIAERGISVLDAALENDIYIPHLCHHPDLKPVGACRLCGVEIDGGRMVMSCLTPAREGINVVTDSPAIYQTRKIAMELLIADHHMDCLACAAANNCELLNTSAYLGIQPDRLERLRPSNKGCRSMHPIPSSSLTPINVWCAGSVSAPVMRSWDWEPWVSSTGVLKP